MPSYNAIAFVGTKIHTARGFPMFLHDFETKNIEWVNDHIFIGIYEAVQSLMRLFYATLLTDGIGAFGINVGLCPISSLFSSMEEDNVRHKKGNFWIQVLFISIPLHGSVNSMIS